MRIALVHGQNHKGNTYHIARMAAEKIGGEIDEFFLPRDFNEGCSACLACLHKGREHCPRSEQVGRIFDSMLCADVIIMSSPTYIMEMTSHLKGFLEHIFTAWLAHRPEEAMFSKTAVMVSTAAAMGMGGVTKSMAKQMFYLGIPKVYRLPFRVLAADWGGVPERIKSKIEAKTNGIARRIIASNGRATPGIRMKLMFSMMRAFQRNNEHAPLDREYWRSNNWLGNGRPWRHT